MQLSQRDKPGKEQLPVCGSADMKKHVGSKNKHCVCNGSFHLAQEGCTHTSPRGGLGASALWAFHRRERGWGSGAVAALMWGSCHRSFAEMPCAHARVSIHNPAHKC